MHLVLIQWGKKHLPNIKKILKKSNVFAKMICGPQLYNEQFQIYIVISEERWKKNLKTLTKQNTMNSEKEVLTCPSEEVEGVARRAGGIPEHPLQNLSTLSLEGALWASAQRLRVSLPCCQLVRRVVFFLLFFCLFIFLVCLFMASLVVQMVKNLPTTQDTWVRSLNWEDPLEKGMATHCSILAWRIPWTEEPAGLQSMGSHRVGHDWATNTFTYLFIWFDFFGLFF